MKLSIERKDGQFYLCLVYSRGEWERIEDMYQKMGLERYHTQRLFGEQSAEVYRYREGAQVPGMWHTGDVNVIDDINAPFLSYGSPDYRLTVNVALFRIIPAVEGNNRVVRLLLNEELIPKELLRSVGVLFKKHFERLLTSKVVVRYLFEITLGESGGVENGN